MPNLSSSTRFTAGRTALGIARLMTVAILSFWGYFIVAHLVGNAGAASRPLVRHDYASFGLMVCSLLGLAIALRRERPGAILTLIAVMLGTLFNWRVLLFPGTLIPMTAVLFLFVSSRRSGNRSSPTERDQV